MVRCAHAQDPAKPGWGAGGSAWWQKVGWCPPKLLSASPTRGVISRPGTRTYSCVLPCWREYLGLRVSTRLPQPLAPWSLPPGFPVDVAQGHTGSYCRTRPRTLVRKLPAPKLIATGYEFRKQTFSSENRKSWSTFFNHLKPESEMEKYLKFPHQEVHCLNLD